jgi:hypothetical protein
MNHLIASTTPKSIKWTVWWFLPRLNPLNEPFDRFYHASIHQMDYFVVSTHTCVCVCFFFLWYNTCHCLRVMPSSVMGSVVFCLCGERWTTVSSHHVNQEAHLKSEWLNREYRQWEKQCSISESHNSRVELALVCVCVFVWWKKWLPWVQVQRYCSEVLFRSTVQNNYCSKELLFNSTVHTHTLYSFTQRHKHTLYIFTRRRCSLQKSRYARKHAGLACPME